MSGFGMRNAISQTWLSSGAATTVSVRQLSKLPTDQLAPELHCWTRISLHIIHETSTWPLRCLLV